MMKRRSFIKSTVVAGLATSTQFSSRIGMGDEADREFYELRIYELTSRGRISTLANFLGNSLIPALNRMGSKPIGVFREISNPEPPVIFVLIPYDSGLAVFQSTDLMNKDDVYQSSSREFHGLSSDHKVFSRYETRLYRAFTGLPKMIIPGDGPRIFELRTYEGYSDDAVRRKVKMFNEGELDLFFKTGLHPVFFGEAIAGKDLPYLTYMLTFQDMEEREANWQAFIDHPEWKELSSKPEFADSVSKIHKTFLQPLEISQI
jgi:hypothetical protein